MTLKTIEMAIRFINSDAQAENFVSLYIDQWHGMSAEELTSEGVNSDRASSDIFMLADCYNPAPDRDESEIDEAELRKKIKETLEKFQLL
ncbi:colicin immunity domain-containing protein [Pseudomonas batumici]|uniref:colicin immunity domain-containing protein n=1 Tax=Pseudomonas batumici TaxID=226910 RepID=UPI000589C991|nr:colicin immunity domain-containing protein [Pseudomonas batumici]